MPQKLETLQHLQQHLAKIYGHVNAQLSESEILIRLDENCGTLFSSGGSGADHLQKSLLKILSWHLALCSKLGLDLQNAYLQRFPRVCPICLEKRCACYLPISRDHIRVDKARQELESLYHSLLSDIENDRFVPSLDQLAQMQESIFIADFLIWDLRPERFYFNLAIERAQIIERYRSYSLKKETQQAKKVLLRSIGEEAADFLRWLLAIWALDRREGKAGQSIQQQAANTFADGCNYCHAIPCECAVERRLGITSEERLSLLSSIKVSDELADIRLQVVQLLTRLEQIADPAIAVLSTEGKQAASVVGGKSRLIAFLRKLPSALKSGAAMGKDAAEITKQATEILERLT